MADGNLAGIAGYEVIQMRPVSRSSDRDAEGLAIRWLRLLKLLLTVLLLGIALLDAVSGGIDPSAFVP